MGDRIFLNIRRSLDDIHPLLLKLAVDCQNPLTMLAVHIVLVSCNKTMLLDERS